MVLKVFIIGSCRVHQDLNHSDLQIMSDKCYYPHSSPEIVQYLDLLKGYVCIPQTLWPYMMIDPLKFNPDRTLSNLNQSDVVIIEISSTNQVQDPKSGVYLNLVRSQDLNYPKLEISRELIITNLVRITQQLKSKKLIFVTHIENNNNTRSQAIQFITQEVTKLGYLCLQPRKILGSHYTQGITDDNHYSKLGQKLIQEALIRTILGK